MEDCSIPVLDLEKFSVIGNCNDFSRALVEIFCTTGFVYLTNHGIDMAMVSDAMAASRKFFHLKNGEKLKYKRPDGVQINSGYVPVGMERLNAFLEEEHETTEFKEAYNFLPFDTERMPIEVPELEISLKLLFSACWQLAKKILAALAKGLKLPQPDVFKESHQLVGKRGNPTTLRTLLYPAVNLAEEEAHTITRCGTHSDYGTITLLFQDDVGGLEVENRNDEFVPAVPMKGCVLVNVGDLLQRWTADKLRSTRHRVRINNGSGTTRQSLAFFVHPDDEYVIRCLDGTEKYCPISAGDYLQNRFQMTY